MVTVKCRTIDLFHNILATHLFILLINLIYFLVINYQIIFCSIILLFIYLFIFALSGSSPAYFLHCYGGQLEN